MRLLGLDKIEAFKKKHVSSIKALDAWVALVRSTNWSSPVEVKRTFGKRVYFVGKQTVFDVHGNKIRLISKIEYGVKILFITHVLDHATYDKEKWKE